MGEINWSCKCGNVQGTCAVNSCARIVCYCASCRGFVEAQGAAHILDAAGGNDLLQTAPDAFTFTKGADQLAWTKRTEKGPLRWFTTCCGTPIANTLSSPAMPFLSLQTAFFEAPDAAGPVMARVNRKGATAHIEGEMGSMRGVMFGFFKRAIKARLNGSYKKNPFFDANGAPVAAQAVENT